MTAQYGDGPVFFMYDRTAVDGAVFADDGLVYDSAGFDDGPGHDN